MVSFQFPQPFHGLLFLFQNISPHLIVFWGVQIIPEKLMRDFTEKLMRDFTEKLMRDFTEKLMRDFTEKLMRDFTEKLMWTLIISNNWGDMSNNGF